MQKMKLKIEENILLSNFSTFGIGGPAKFFTRVKSVDEAQAALAYASENTIPFLILGSGSNILFNDDGFNGLVILNKINHCQFFKNEVLVGSGCPIASLGLNCIKRELAGLEFTPFIPGSVGGAIYMNASANNLKISDVISEVEYLTKEGEKIIFKSSEMDFSYRYSSFQKMNGFITSAKFLLSWDKNVLDKYEDIKKFRLSTQPQKQKSAGCVFKNPMPSLSAGYLIDSCGLKGFTIGDATVSSVHANFILNKGNASCKDVVALINHIKNCVKQKTGIELELEISIIGLL